MFNLIIIFEFQFHKVRLKGNESARHRHRLLVSIPQGTIKRRYGYYQGGDFVQFQFHKVRLKVYTQDYASETFERFNSTRYD